MSEGEARDMTKRDTALVGVVRVVQWKETIQRTRKVEGLVVTSHDDPVQVAAPEAPSVVAAEPT